MAAHGGESAVGGSQPPLVCMYLFLDAGGATVPPHPSPRTSSPLRYLECALVQAASLRVAGAPCEVALVTNVDGRQLPRSARRLWDALGELGVQRLPAPLRIDPGADPACQRLAAEAIRAAVAGARPEHSLWVPNLDCVWLDPARALRAGPPADAVGVLAIPYPPDWRVGGPEEIGATRAALGRRARALGAAGADAPPWIGGDVLAGSAAALAAAIEACEQLERELGATATNEQLLTLAAALGRIEIVDLSPLARRIQTGARHTAGVPADAAELALWHLPAEKGLSLRRTARLLARGGRRRFAADLSSPPRAMRRFNVGSARRIRQLRDDAWVALGRLPGGRTRLPAVSLHATGPRAEGRKE